MIFSRASSLLIALSVAVAGIGGVNAQNCPSNDNGQCDFAPTNPHVCGDNFSCSYATICHAEAAGYNIDDCCQSPQASACGMIYDPLICGSKECPYANLCLAELSGYSESQCTTPPPECPTGSRDCSGEPSNPHTCGSQACPYRSICEARDAGFDVSNDCCQDTRTATACNMMFAPVHCGSPNGKTCNYDNQCLADAAGYSGDQCCKSVPEGIACTGNYNPVECGAIPCFFVNVCEATAAGYAPSDCCPQANGACTMDNNPVACGENFCSYGSQSCADLAGFSEDDCMSILYVGDEEYVGHYDRSCRVDGDRGNYDSDTVDLQTCRNRCTSDRGCTGYEFTGNSGLCEYHKTSGLPYADEKNGAFSSRVQDNTQCFWKVNSAAVATPQSAADTSGSPGRTYTSVFTAMAVIMIMSLLVKLA